MIVEPGQNIIDVAVLSGYGAEYAFYLAMFNSISPTDVIVSGQNLNEPIFKKEYYLSFEELIINSGISILADVISYPNQSLLDIATQEDGSALALVEWAINNQINPTDDIIAGQKFKAIQSTQRKNKVANYIAGNRLKIVTSRNLPHFDSLDYYLPGEFPYSF